jgi:hypothetical protein
VAVALVGQGVVATAEADDGVEDQGEGHDADHRRDRERDPPHRRRVLGLRGRRLRQPVRRAAGEEPAARHEDGRPEAPHEVVPTIGTVVPALVKAVSARHQR